MHVGLLTVLFNERDIDVAAHAVAVGSLQIPSGAEISVLVVDNGSWVTPWTTRRYEQMFLGSHRRLDRREINRIHVVRLPTNTGFGNAFNVGVIGLLESGVDWVFSIAARARPRKDWLVAMLGKIRASDNKCWALRGLEYPDESSDVIGSAGHRISPTGGCFDIGYRLEKSMLTDLRAWSDLGGEPFCTCSGNAGYAREFFETAGLIDTRFEQAYTCADIGWRARVLEPERRVHLVVDAVTYQPRNHGRSFSREDQRTLGVRRRERNRVITIHKYVPRSELQGVLERYLSEPRRDGTSRAVRRVAVHDALSLLDGPTGHGLEASLDEFSKDAIWREITDPNARFVGPVLA